ncbi:DNA-directed RNA polymerase sigma-70 factor [Bacteroidia bacterium]|nr:DNA-directed RNA polymerase sigma-70 factor [Bacteroidia bacterium]GHV54757.1 DNA-directed RNA polymerase sigma-70 factor [Bacteroidia bacterium]
MPKAGDDEKFKAFKNLYEANAGTLIRFAKRFASSPDMAEDIVHEVFLELWKNDKELNEPTSHSFLFAAVRNRCINILKRQQLSEDYVHNVQIENRLLGLDYYDSIEKLIIEKEDLQRVYRQIDLLPDKCRQIFKLSYFDEKKNAEIAELLNLSIRTVEHQLYLALKTLRDKLRRK